MLGVLADAYSGAGRYTEAVVAAEMGLAVCDNTMRRLWHPELLRVKGEAFLKLEDHTEEEAESLFRHAIEIAQGQQATSLELRAATSLAGLWKRRGKRAEAGALLAPVYNGFTEGFDTQDLRDAKTLLEDLR